MGNHAARGAAVIQKVYPKICATCGYLHRSFLWTECPIHNHRFSGEEVQSVCDLWTEKPTVGVADAAIEEPDWLKKLRADLKAEKEKADFYYKLTVELETRGRAKAG